MGVRPACLTIPTSNEESCASCVLPGAQESELCYSRVSHGARVRERPMNKDLGFLTVDKDS